MDTRWNEQLETIGTTLSIFACVSVCACMRMHFFPIGIHQNDTAQNSSYIYFKYSRMCNIWGQCSCGQRHSKMCRERLRWHLYMYSIRYLHSPYLILLFNIRTRSYFTVFSCFKSKSKTEKLCTNILTEEENPMCSKTLKTVIHRQTGPCSIHGLSGSTKGKVQNGMHIYIYTHNS